MGTVFEYQLFQVEESLLVGCLTREEREGREDGEGLAGYLCDISNKHRLPNQL